MLMRQALNCAGVIDTQTKLYLAVAAVPHGVNMALRVLKPRLSKLPPRLSTPREVRDKRYSPDATVRGWYHSARWQRLRQAVLDRDLYTCQHTGIILTGKAPAPNSAVVHHKIPHKGDERLFWDSNNLESVAKSWHDSEAQREERQYS